MRKAARMGVLALGLCLSSAAAAQLGLPGVSPVLRDVRATLDGVMRPVLGTVRDAATLASERVGRLGDHVRAHRDRVEFDEFRQPARARELLLVDPDPVALALAGAAGFELIEQGAIDGLDLRYARLSTPAGTNLAAATRTLRTLLPGKDISADQLHFPSGAVAPAKGGHPAPARPIGGTVGVIDGGVNRGARVALQAGFANGAPRPSDHAQAIVSLLGGAGTARIVIADVYGTDPAGGNALAIARALGWMTANRVPVVSISLVGPANPLLARAIAAAQTRGVIVVAAVGNDGAAAPPAFPASYPGVVAVTGVDAQGRVLFEAGRAAHLDYAAPGADLTAIGANGRAQSLRGTSFAAPLAAARIAALTRPGDAIAVRLGRADAEAAKGRARTGRGVLCGSCRTGI